MNIRIRTLAAVMLVATPLAFGAPPVIQPAAQDAQAETTAYQEANRKMMSTMGSMAPTGEPDQDFVMMMIPHHQGAIDMAKIELQYGKDPMLRAMAESIVKSQQEEIDKMKKWQQEHGM